MNTQELRQVADQLKTEMSEATQAAVDARYEMNTNNDPRKEMDLITAFRAAADRVKDLEQRWAAAEAAYQASLDA